MSEDPWKHRSQGMRCKTCMWFAPKLPGEVVSLTGGALPVIDLGRCRRHAPTMNGYPAVFVNDWCGDHKLDENKISRGSEPVVRASLCHDPAPLGDATCLLPANHNGDHRADGEGWANRDQLPWLLVHARLGDGLRINQATDTLPAVLVVNVNGQAVHVRKSWIQDAVLLMEGR